MANKPVSQRAELTNIYIIELMAITLTITNATTKNLVSLGKKAYSKCKNILEYVELIAIWCPSARPLNPPEGVDLSIFHKSDFLTIFPHFFEGKQLEIQFPVKIHYIGTASDGIWVCCLRISICTHTKSHRKSWLVNFIWMVWSCVHTQWGSWLTMVSECPILFI